MWCCCELARLRGRDRAPGGARNAHARASALRLLRSGVHALTPARSRSLPQARLRGRDRAPGGARNAHARASALRLLRSGVHAQTPARSRSWPQARLRG